MRRITLFFAAAVMVLSFTVTASAQRLFGAKGFGIDDGTATAGNVAWLTNLGSGGSLLVNAGASSPSIADPQATNGFTSVLLDLSTTSKGLLLPRVANDAAITNPNMGLIIYNIATNTIDVNTNGTAGGWVPVSPSPSGTSANEGIVFNNTSGTFQYRLGASGGAAATTNPFLANRSINLDAFNLNFTSNGGVLTPFSITGGAAPTINAIGATSINTSGAGTTSIGNTGTGGAVTVGSSSTYTLTAVGGASINNTLAGGTTIGSTATGGAVSINAAAGGVAVNTGGVGNITLAPAGTGNIAITGNGTGTVALTQTGVADPNILVGSPANNVVISNNTVTGPLGALATNAHANLDVRGSMAENTVTVVNGTTNYTVALNDLMIICANSNAQTLNVHLPTTSAAGMTPGRILTVKLAGSPTGAGATYGQVNIDAGFNFLDNVTGATAFILTAGAAHSVQMTTDGSNWWIIAYQ